MPGRNDWIWSEGPDADVPFHYDDVGAVIHGMGEEEPQKTDRIRVAQKREADRVIWHSESGKWLVSHANNESIRTLSLSFREIGWLKSETVWLNRSLGVVGSTQRNFFQWSIAECLRRLGGA